MCNGVTDMIEESICRAGVLHGAQSLQVTAVGRQANFGITAHVGDPFGHGEPAQDALSATDAAAIDPELIGMIDHGFDTQYAPMFVVHFDTVGFHPVFDPGPGPSLLVLGADFTLEVPVEFSSEEGHDILGAEAHGGMLEQFFVQELQTRTVLEEDVRSKLGLIDYPVVEHGVKQILEQRVDLASKGIEDTRPVFSCQGVGKPLCPKGIVELEEGVSLLQEAYTMSFHLSCQPLVTVDIDLDDEREPGLDPHMHKAKFSVDPIEVETKTAWVGMNDSRLSLSVGELEALALFDKGEHTDQPFGDVVPSSQVFDKFFLTDGPIQVDVGTRAFFRHGHGVLFETFRALGHEGLEIFEQKALLIHEAFHGLGITHGKVPFEQNSIKTAQGAIDFVFVFPYESFHGALLGLAWWKQP